MGSYLGHLALLARSMVNTVYKLMTAITCEIIDPASSNSVFWLYVTVSNEFVFGSL